MQTFTEQEIAFQNQAIGIDWSNLSINRAIELCEKIEAACWAPNFHEQIDDLEVALESYPELVLNPEPVHKFSKGLYLRELTIPKGAFLTGMLHRRDHLCVVSKGRILVWTQGIGPEIIEAPTSFPSKAGVRRIGYAYEETVWSTVHATDITDIDRLEEILFELRPHQTKKAPVR